MRFLLRIDCFILGHRIETVKRYDRVHRRVACAHCGGDWYVGWFEGHEAWLPWSEDCERMALLWQQVRDYRTTDEAAVATSNTGRESDSHG